MQRTLPHPSLTNSQIPELFESNDGNGIRIKGWEISSKKSSILSSSEIDDYSKELNLPLPEMIFGNNKVTVKNENLGININFNPIEALKLVDTSENSSKLKVAYSEAWYKERQDWDEVKEVANPYDWTYTSNYSGTNTLRDTVKIEENTKDRIDLEILKQTEPILFYADNILFEDELGDNGSAVLNVKIRVMPSGFFLLQRFSLRVDNVLFRVRDTRIYHGFNTNFMIKEYSERECPFDQVLQLLPPNSDKSHLADMQIIYQTMCTISNEPNALKVTKLSW
ncbi:TIP41-domain-containing protein [Neoconidiobolus thromboides FSU 785]|nr:TIP41-domain-containing protein [Neoconidiobolus thromboides FSU 785]